MKTLFIGGIADHETHDVSQFETHWKVAKQPIPTFSQSPIALPSIITEDYKRVILASLEGVRFDYFIPVFENQSFALAKLLAYYAKK